MAETAKRLERSALAHYLDTNFNTTSESPAWFLIGKHVADMSVNLNPQSETVKNILDQTSVIDNGYEPGIDVDTYYADPSDGAFYEKMKDIAMNRLTGDACKTYLLEVLIDKTTGAYDAWMEEVIVKPQSYGGAQGGVRIPYNIKFNGNRRKGTVTIVDRVPTFTEAAES